MTRRPQPLLTMTPGQAKTLRRAREASLRLQGWVPESEARAKQFLGFGLGWLVGVLVTIILTALS